MTAANRAGHTRVALGLLLATAAAPFRYYGSFPLVASLSVLDAAVLLAAVVLLARRVMAPHDDPGDRWAAILLGLPPLLCLTSLLWSADVPATIRTSVSYAEALVVFLFAVQQTRGLPADRIVRMLRYFLYLLLVPSVLMLLHVPGFEPQDPGGGPTSGPYLSFFSRLSHPFIGRSNNLATVLLLLCVVLVHWAVTHRGVAAYLAALVCTAAILLTVSRGAILALLGAALVAVLLPRGPRGSGHPRPVLTAVLSGVLLAAMGWTFYLLNPTTQEFLGNRLNLSNVALRELRFSDGVGYLLERPFLGYGAGTLPGGNPAIAGGVHDTYLQQLLAYGVVLGLVSALSLVGLAVHVLWRQPPGLRRAVGLALVALLIDLAVESSFEGASLRVIIYLLIGMLVGLTRAGEVQRRLEALPWEPAVGRPPLPALQG